MPAAIAELVVQGSTPAIHCPLTGRVIVDAENGLDLDEPHSPHIRFIWDWVGEPYLADPELLPTDQAEYQRRVVALFSDDDEVTEQFESFDAVVEACRAVMPPSVLILKFTTPPQGSDTGSEFWIAFDFASLPEGAPETIELLHADALNA